MAKVVLWCGAFAFFYGEPTECSKGFGGMNVILYTASLCIYTRQQQQQQQQKYKAEWMNEWMIAVLGIGFNYNSLKAAKINSWDKKEIRSSVYAWRIYEVTQARRMEKKASNQSQVSSTIY